jgi:hypothetical protein
MNDFIYEGRKRSPGTKETVCGRATVDPWRRAVSVTAERLPCSMNGMNKR